MTAWIKMISDEEASLEQQAAFDHARAPSGTLDNVMRVHSLRPHTMIGHYDLYMSVLHNENNRLPDWLLEVIASYVSILNDCPYSLANHFSNARHLIANDAKADEILAALNADSPSDVFTGRELAALRYARQLTRHPSAMTREDVEAMRRAGLDDGEILEVNQICCYFNYVNRLLNGLGVTLEGDTIGYYGNES